MSYFLYIPAGEYRQNRDCRSSAIGCSYSSEKSLISSLFVSILVVSTTRNQPFPNRRRRTTTVAKIHPSEKDSA